MIWFGLQLIGALLLMKLVPQENRPFAASIAGIGAGLTVLAFQAWERILQTYRTFLWDFCRFDRPSELMAVCFRGETESDATATTRGVTA